ncbi:MAG: YceI family protein [Verrucomicrobiae bacterium]|nr:YceI family protein [Verrucomicrobiae bacterium]
MRTNAHGWPCTLTWSEAVALAVWLVMVPAPVLAQDSAVKLVRYNSQPGSLVQIDGTSNIHDWTVKGGVIRGFIEADEDFPASVAAPGARAPRVEVTIPVRTLKSQVAVGAKKMDEVMQEHMKMAQWPNIEYRLIELVPKAVSPGAGTAFQFDAVGALTVAGVTRTNRMPVTIERLDQTRLKVTGTTNLKMTEFGITPPSPTLSLGLIRTGDDVKVRVEWIVARAQGQESGAPAN